MEYKAALQELLDKIISMPRSNSGSVARGAPMIAPTKPNPTWLKIDDLELRTRMALSAADTTEPPSQQATLDALIEDFNKLSDVPIISIGEINIDEPETRK